jgi:hypothetical protein
MPAPNYPSARNYVAPKAACMLKQTSKIDPCELTIYHALEEMRVKLKLPAPC